MIKTSLPPASQYQSILVVGIGKPMAVRPSLKATVVRTVMANPNKDELLMELYLRHSTVRQILINLFNTLTYYRSLVEGGKAGDGEAMQIAKDRAGAAKEIIDSISNEWQSKTFEAEIDQLGPLLEFFRADLS